MSENNSDIIYVIKIIIFIVTNVSYEHYDEGGRKSTNYVQTSGGKGVEKFHVCALSTISSF